MPASNLLMIFAKEPVVGKVKTRLGRSIGNPQAARVYALMLNHLLSTLHGPDFERVIYKTPDSGADYFSREFPGVRLADQSAGDLGDKMAQAFSAEFARGFRRICIIGTDCPDILPEDLALVFAALDQQDVVLGPAADGGYFLMGLRAAHPALFTDIPWSGPDVLRLTRERIKRAGLSALDLADKQDIDDEAGLRNYLRQASGSRLAARLHDILAEEHPEQKFGQGE